MPVYNKRGILLLPKVIVLNPKDGQTRFAMVIPSNAIYIHSCQLKNKAVLQADCFYKDTTFSANRKVLQKSGNP